MILFIITGCGTTTQKQTTANVQAKSDKIRVTDMAGRKVKVPLKINKLIALGCTLREVEYLDSCDKVVGIEYRENAKQREGVFPCGKDLPYLIAHPELGNLPVVSAGNSINYEEIVKLKPDVIFTPVIPTYQAEFLQIKVGIPVVMVYADPIGTTEQDKQYYDSLNLMGKILGKEKRADEIIKIITDYQNDLKSRTKSIPDNKKLKVYIAGRAFCGSQGITGTDPHWPPFEWINAKNVASLLSNKGKSINVDKEKLIDWNPDVIFISEASLSTVINDLKDPAYKNINAVKNKKIYGVLPYCWYAYNKETAIADAYYIGKILYPEKFTDIDPEKKADEIYQNFVGKPVYKELKEQFGGFKEIKVGQ
ncbi:iron ABC transporter substrate-binding protein [Aceticella autotrophica]|nr:iron ABC transporter substrate-binding protein [Aceticella autotrophica]